MATAARTVDVAPFTALWRTAQVCGLVLTLLLLAGLWLYPEPSLRVLWYAVIPVLPALFLVHPGVWRNVCPLATLNLLPRRISLGRKLNAHVARAAMIGGFALLVVLVPARRFVFNMDGPLLALMIAAVALLALMAGFVFDRKAGFCNSICPVLPVEKLYGQHPLTRVDNVHCADCSLCTARGCLDLAPRKAAIIAAQPHPRERKHWLMTSYGVFAAAFPGFVLAYYLIPDTTFVHAASVYLKVANGAAISFAAVALVAVPLRVPTRHALPMLAAFTLLLYYWFGAASIAGAWQLGTPFVHTTRLAAFVLVGWWLVRRNVETRKTIRS